jgi:hypothetical protein
MSKERIARLCFGVTFAIAASSLALQFVQDWLGVWDDPGTAAPPHAVRVWRFFSYFTTQANLLVVATSLSLAVRPGRDGSGWRVARLNALRHHDHRARSLVLVATRPLPRLAVGLRHAGPHHRPASLLSWLLFGPRRRVSARVVLLGMIWRPPGCYTFVVGWLTGWYPYFFLDLGQLARTWLGCTAERS